MVQIALGVKGSQAHLVNRNVFYRHLGSPFRQSQPEKINAPPFMAITRCGSLIQLQVITITHKDSP